MRPALQWFIPGRGVLNIKGLLEQRRCCSTEKYFKIGKLIFVILTAPPKAVGGVFFVRHAYFLNFFLIFAVTRHTKSSVSIIFDRQLRMFIKYFVLI
jgi:hypothetical protein